MDNQINNNNFNGGEKGIMVNECQEVTDKYVEKYGLNANLGVLAEELAELIQVILKYQRSMVKDAVIRDGVDKIKANMLSEVQDVIFCMEYVYKVLGITRETAQMFANEKAKDNMERLGANAKK